VLFAFLVLLVFDHLIFLQLQRIEDEDDVSEQSETTRAVDIVKERSLDAASSVLSRASIKLKPLAKAATATPSTPRQQTPLSRAGTVVSNDAATTTGVADTVVKTPSFVMPFRSRAWFEKYFIGDVCTSLVFQL